MAGHTPIFLKGDPGCPEELGLWGGKAGDGKVWFPAGAAGRSSSASTAAEQTDMGQQI